MSERRLPPVTQLGMLSLGLIVAAVIYLSAHLPQHVPLGPAIALLSVSALLLAGTVFALWRTPGFAWARFIEVAKWALLAYTIVAGMIEFVFLANHTSGGPLIVMTLCLIVFALTVPVLIGFTTARYAEAEPASGGASA
jgi:hypothetical protein